MTIEIPAVAVVAIVLAIGGAAATAWRRLGELVVEVRALTATMADVATALDRTDARLAETREEQRALDARVGSIEERLGRVEERGSGRFVMVPGGAAGGGGKA